MADDCWGSNTIRNTEPDEWGTEEGYKAFHSRYLHNAGGSSWTCNKCGALVGSTGVHDEWHKREAKKNA